MPGASRAATDWRRRPNLFAGRTLTDATLQGRQAWQAGHLQHRARSLTAGVVRGLEVFALPGSGGARLLIEPGQGLAVSGEDLVLVCAFNPPLNGKEVHDEHGLKPLDAEGIARENRTTLIPSRRSAARSKCASPRPRLSQPCPKKKT